MKEKKIDVYIKMCSIIMFIISLIGSIIVSMEKKEVSTFSSRVIREAQPELFVSIMLPITLSCLLLFALGEIISNQYKQINTDNKSKAS